MNLLKLHSYEIQLTRGLRIADHQKRLGLASDFLQLTSDNLISRLIISDEAHYYLTGHVSTQNCRY